MYNHITYRCSHCGFILYEQKGRCPHCNVLLTYEPPKNKYKRREKNSLILSWLFAILFGFLLTSTFIGYFIRSAAESHQNQQAERGILVTQVIIFGFFFAIAVWNIRRAKK